MQRFVPILAAAVLASLPAAAAPVAFSGSISRVNPGPQPGLRCAPALTIVNGNSGGSSAGGTSNIGAFSYEGTQCIVPPPTGTFNGLWTMDFGGGVTLKGTNSSVLTLASPGIFNIAVNYLVTGGTGRFGRATGSFDETGTLDRRDLSRTVALGDFAGTIQTPTPGGLAFGGLVLGAGMLAARRRRSA
jgi:hypothetical protein